jgi:hypothetical protein
VSARGNTAAARLEPRRGKFDGAEQCDQSSNPPLLQGPITITIKAAPSSVAVGFALSLDQPSLQAGERRLPLSKRQSDRVRRQIRYPAITRQHLMRPNRLVCSGQLQKDPPPHPKPLINYDQKLLPPPGLRRSLALFGAQTLRCPLIYPHPIGNTTAGSRLGQIAVIEKRERDRFRHPVQKK